nr:LysR substrate-binding domain-containing protein [Liquorilactobacillus satsumensis]
MLNTWRLQLLVQLSKLGGTMRLVAEAMLISPATVSMQLKILETETSTVLLEKIGRNVKLTAAGQRLVKEVSPILNQLESVTNELQDSAQEVQGTVRIAAFSSALRALVLPAVAQVNDSYPQIKIILNEMEPDQSLPGLQAHQFDIALIAQLGTGNALTDPEYQLINLGADQLQVLVNQASPLAKNESISIDLLKEQAWMLEPDTAYLTKAVRRLCQQAGFSPNVSGICQSYTTLQAAVSHNWAIGVLPTLAVTQTANVKLLNLQPATLRQIFLAVRKPQARVRAIQIVVQAIQEQAAALF